VVDESLSVCRGVVNIGMVVGSMVVGSCIVLAGLWAMVVVSEAGQMAIDRAKKSNKNNHMSVECDRFGGGVWV